MNTHKARRLIQWQQQSRAAYARTSIGDVPVPCGWFRPMSDHRGNTWVRMISLGIDAPTSGVCCTVTDLHRIDWAGSFKYNYVRVKSFLSATMSEQAFLADLAEHISLGCTPVGYLELEEAARAVLEPASGTSSPFPAPAALHYAL